MQQVVDNVESANKSGVNKLVQAELDTITKLRDAINKYVVVPCTRCGYCTPCPNNVSIPTIFRILNETVYWGENPLTGYNRLAKTPEEFARRRDGGEDVGGAATLCTKCGECLEKCPQQIEIPDMMDKVMEIFENKKDIKKVLEIE
jgi:predicted aldo/keto reductase-like oxidoreductase